MSKPVNQYSIDGVLIKRWKSIACASMSLGISNGNIVGVCKHKHNTSGGFMWAYANDPVPVYEEPKK